MKALACTLAALALLALCGALPFDGHDAAELQPVRALVAEFSDNGVQISGDSGLSGSGATWDEAVAQFKASADGVAFLQTAEKIILTGNLPQALKAVTETDALRPAAEVFCANAAADAEELYEYLKTRTSSATVSQLRAALHSGAYLPVPALEISQEGVRLKDE